ncbi:MAG: hypothetical protein JW910_12780 [Anaerolineae bacterium]|nr:hypothetical protein [Anaerolineae bacterium]
MTCDEDSFRHDLPGFYAQVVLAVLDHTSLLAIPRLARGVASVMEACADNAPGRLWGYVVLPDALRFVVGPAGDETLDAFVDTIRACSSARLLDLIRRADDDSLDRVLRYNPVWGGAIYRVWEAGCHRQIFWSAYKLSNALYDLRWLPVAAGLVESPEQWPFGRVGSDAA